jgi:hypothetical protein
MATYYVWSGATGLANGSSWTDAYTSLGNLFTGVAIAGGDSILIASDHDNVSYAASQTWLFPESGVSTSSHVYLVSTNRASGLPEVGAIEQTGGNFYINIYGRINAYGVTFKTGDGTSNFSANFQATPSGTTNNYGKAIYNKCTFIINSTNASNFIKFGGGFSTVNELIDCLFQFGSVSQFLTLSYGSPSFVNCGLIGSVFPTTLFNMLAADTISISGCDFSASTNLVKLANGVKTVIFALNSFLPATINSTTIDRAGMLDFEAHSCASTDHTYFYKKVVHEGTIVHDVSVYLTSGGATTKDSDGSNVNYSLNLTSAANTYNCSTSNPLYSPWFHVPVFSTGSKTFSIKVAHEQAAVLKDNEVWMEVEYMGGTATVNTPQTVREITAPLITGTVFQDYRAAGSNLTDTAEAWTGLASEKTHTLSKTVTVDEQGYARVRVALAVNNISIYVNPNVAVA